MEIQITMPVGKQKSNIQNAKTIVTHEDIEGLVKVASKNVLYMYETDETIECIVSTDELHVYYLSND